MRPHMSTATPPVLWVSNMATEQKFGMDFVGDIPWGTHLCQFYETKRDLSDILVPYFAEGLRSNEACMWITSEPLGVEEATAALKKAVPDIDRFIKSRQLIILPYTEWYFKGGTFDADRVLQGWIEKEKEALNRGFEGLRLTGNTFWIERGLWNYFADYEEVINNVLGAHRIIAVCTYSLRNCNGSNVIDVLRNHGGTIIRKGATWSVVEDVVVRKEAEVALQEAHKEMQSLNEAHEEVRSLNEALQSTKEELMHYSQHLEELIAERTSQLRGVERLAGIGETAAMIGHDLRNPLQGLHYIVDLQKLRFERVPPEKRGADDWKNEEKLFDRISEQIFYMDKIVADLQDYARPIAPEREVVAVSALIKDVLASLPYTDDVKIVSDVSDLEVTVDPHLVHRAFANLILNALQAMPEGGTLTINASASDHAVAISVRDTGVGIPEEMEDKLFSPLITGKAKGTGLGLAVVKRIVDAHGGTITFESQEGKGTTFTVTLPETSE